MSDSADVLLRQSVGAILSEHAPQRLGVAVSGGSDSMALLDVMQHWSRKCDCHLEAVTLDHGLRAEAADEAAMVAEHCKARGIAHSLLRWDWDRQGNLQAAARDARYRLIAGWAQARQIEAVALGHTQDDQAETFVMRLGRAAGPDGLATMDARFVRHGTTWLRPLLDLSRAELRGYLQRQSIGWAEDPSNADTQFERVRARRVLAALEPMGVTRETLKTVSEHMRLASQALRQYASREAEGRVILDRGDVLLPQADDAVSPEIMRRWRIASLRLVAGLAYPPRQRALDAMEAELRHSGRATLSGCLVTQDGAQLRIAREWNAVKDMETLSSETWDGRWQIHGRHAPGLTLRALGEDGLKNCPDWRETGMRRASLLASPAVWRGPDLIAAPLAGMENGWTATITPERDDFTRALHSH